MALIVSQFHRSLSQQLVDGAVSILSGYRVRSQDVHRLWVPGVFELPIAAAHLCLSQPRPHAIIALGVLIRGQTIQYAVIAQAVAQGLVQVSVMNRIPVTFGVIVAPTLAQAKARAGGRMGNRGTEAALAAIELLWLLRR